MAYNSIVTLHPNMRSLPNLKDLRLGHNEPVYLPAEVGTLTNITHLSLVEHSPVALPTSSRSFILTET